MNSVIPQIAHDAKPANPRRVSMISSLLVSGSSAPSGLTQIVSLSRLCWQGEAGTRERRYLMAARLRLRAAPSRARDAKVRPRVGSAKSADDQRRVLALAFTHAARLHPVVG